MRTRTNSISKIKKQEIKAGYLFLLPASICLLIWTIIPIISSLGYSLTDFNILDNATFIGLDNYKELFRDKEWLYSLKQTFKYVLMYVPLMFLISLGAAELVKHLTICKGFFRTAYFLPVVVSAVAAGAIFKLVLNTKMGLINKILYAVGLDQINFLGDAGNALGSCVALGIWLGFGYHMIVFLAGLQDIPSDYYEAAAIDGASGLQQFFYITFPALGRTSIFVLTMCFIDSFQTYDVIKMLTDGGPNYSTTLVIQRIYTEAFQHYRMGYACAATVMLFVIIFIVTMLQLKLTNKFADNGWG